MEKQLPKNWVETSPLEISKIIRGVSYGKSDAFQSEFDNSCLILRGGNIQDGEIVDGKDNVYVPLDLIKKEQFIQEHDVVIVGSTGSKNLIGKAATSLFDSDKISFGAFLMNIRAFEPINKRYFSYYFQTNYYREAIRNLAGGVNINNIRKEYIENLYFPLPPLAEQNRIVAKLDALFAQLEIIKTSMAKVPLLLKDFRQQVLTQAVTGKLTEEWRKGKELGDMFDFISNISNEREKNYEELVKIAKKEKIKKPKKDFEFVFKKHPNKENWCIAKLENLVYMSARIGWKGLKAEEYTESGPLFISVHSLNYGENVNYEKAYHISEERFLESPEIMLEENDILLCKDGAGIGKLGIVKNLKEKATVNSSLLVIRGKEAFVNKFLFYFFSGPALQNIAKERITGTAIPHLFQRDIKEFYVDIPPLEEQQEIVSRVESLFAKADVIEKQYEILKAKIDSLPQAILHKAFKGELTQQLDSDGDARELLKQIRELKKSTVKPKKATSKKVKKYPGNETVLRMVAEPK